MLKAMRNFRAPVTVAPQLGTKELGPKSGAHSACWSCEDITLGEEGGPGPPTPAGREGRKAPSHTQPPVGPHLLRQGLVLPSPNGWQGLATGCPCRLTVEIHCKETQLIRPSADGGSVSPVPKGLRQGSSLQPQWGVVLLWLHLSGENLMG
jgi:hypothetical protein